MTDDKRQPSAEQPPRSREGAAGAPPAADLNVDWSSEPVPAYVTGAHVVFTMREFSLLLDEAAPFPRRNAPAGDPERARTRIVASVRMTPDTCFRIASALASSWNRYAGRWMDPRAPRPRFQLVDAGDLQLEGVELPAAPK